LFTSSLLNRKEPKKERIAFACLLENKVNNLEKKIVTIELQFADLVYGTQEFELHQSKLQQHKTSRKDLITEWERIQKKIETLSK